MSDSRHELSRIDDRQWTGHIELRVSEPAGVSREKGLVDVRFALRGAPAEPRPLALRIAETSGGDGGVWREVVAQFYHVQRRGDSAEGSVAFFTSIGPGETRTFRLYFGEKADPAPRYPSSLSVAHRGGGKHDYMIENAFYRIQTMPHSGQIWHIWNKAGSNCDWHHKEWEVNIDKGGDPCDWAPNCWVAYPERVSKVSSDYEVVSMRDVDYIDWHYFFGVPAPQSEIIEGPVFFQTRRWCVVPPHPEHSTPQIKRDGKDRLWMSNTYRFYDGVPWIYHTSRIETLEDLRVFFIRNSQFVFLKELFTHAIVMPERVGLLPHDEPLAAVFPLLDATRDKPFNDVDHSLSNILPPKVEYHSLFNRETGDGFALFQLADRATNLHTGQATLGNHATVLTEMYNACYFMRCYSYVNRRFNPETPTFLPKGEQYEDENYLSVYTASGLEDAAQKLANLNAQLKPPLRTEWE